jgi:transcriptional regulator with XRE-family HTH domain
VLSETLKRELARYAVGEELRSLRLQKGLRLSDLASRSHLSSSLLSKIERGQSVPSLPALQSIAASLGVSLSSFFPRPPRSVPALTRAQERIFLPESLRAKQPAFDFECLNFRAIEPRLNCYGARFRQASRSRTHAHAGCEFLFVLAGTLSISIADEEHVLEDGDSIYFDSHLPHNYAASGSDRCSALVVTLPTFPAEADLPTEGVRHRVRLRANRISLPSNG